MRSVCLGLLVSATLVACSSKSDDPFTADMKMICNAGQSRADLPPERRRIEALREIAEKVQTPEAARLMAGVFEVAPSEKAGYMKDALAKAGIKRCALLEQW